MNGLRLRPGISHRSFAGCAIILDIDRDRYWKVDPHIAMALDWVTGRQSGPVGPEQFARLDQLGLTEDQGRDDEGTNPVECPIPRVSAIEGDAPPTRFNWLEAIEVALLTLSARRTIRQRSLKAIIAEIESRRRSVNGSTTGISSVARRFDRCRRLVPFAKRCLPDTLAFLRFAARRGYFPTLIFGVEAWPFAAHCWAQSGSLVLNDALDHARAFSPIRAI